MQINRIDIDSDIYGKNFLEIVDFSAQADFDDFEHRYIKEYNPFYVSCKVPIENIGDIQALGKLGFEFIEVQIREQINLRKLFAIYKPYRLEEVTSENDLENILVIAANTFAHDRFSVDPFIVKSFSSERYRQYVIKSYYAKDEFLYKLYNTETGEILGFKTHKILNDLEAVLFLGGVANQYKKSAIPVINGYLEMNELIKRGVKKVTTHISVSNYGVLNLEVKEFGY